LTSIVSPALAASVLATKNLFALSVEDNPRIDLTAVDVSSTNYYIIYKTPQREMQKLE